jgi:hypothetical protein
MAAYCLTVVVIVLKPKGSNVAILVFKILYPNVSLVAAISETNAKVNYMHKVIVIY